MRWRARAATTRIPTEARPYISPNTSPDASTSSSGYAVAVDPGTGYAYVAESYLASGGTSQFAITRLTSGNLPDSGFGDLISGSNYTGTFVVPSFGGGNNTPYGMAIEDSGGVDHLAVAGTCGTGGNTFGVVVINISGTGAEVWNSSTANTNPTMPSGQAHGVTFDTGGDVIAVGNDGGSAKVVKLSGSTGTLVSTFGSSGTAAVTFPSMVNSALYAVMDTDPSLSGDVIIGGYGNESGLSNCWLGLAAFDDTLGVADTLFGTNGYDTVNVGNDMSGVEQPSYNDAIYSLMWDDDIPADVNGALVAVGNTNETGHNTPVVWALTGKGNPYQSFGTSHGLSVPNVSATVYGGTVDTQDTLNGTSDPTNGDITVVGQDGSAPSGFLAARLTTSGAFDNTFGSSGVFRADFGTTSGNTAGVARGVALESDGSTIAVGYTGTGGNVAVARYLQENKITVNPSGMSPLRTRVPLDAAAASPALFSSGPPIGGGTGSSDDAAVPSDPLISNTKHRTGHGLRPKFAIGYRSAG